MLRADLLLSNAWVRTLDGPMLRSGESRRAGSFTRSLQEVYDRPASLVRRDRLDHARRSQREALLDAASRDLRVFWVEFDTHCRTPETKRDHRGGAASEEWIEHLAARA